MSDGLLRKIAESDSEGVSALVRGELAGGKRAWDLHLSLFPVAARVLNPPFINPHLPKMYRICREFLPYLEEGDLPALVELEVKEYTARPKLQEFPRAAGPQSPVEFSEVQAAIRERAPERAAVLLNAFLEQKGGIELAHKMLVIGGEHLPDNLGHSLSCTGFILLETR